MSKKINSFSPASIPNSDNSPVSSVSELLAASGMDRTTLKKLLKRKSKKYAKLAAEIGSTEDEETFSEILVDDIADILLGKE